METKGGIRPRNPGQQEPAHEPAFGHRRLTQDEFVTQAAARFGDDHALWAFQCPSCADIAVAGDFPDAVRERLGQECVGRHRSAGGRGCERTAYGPVRGPWEIVMSDGHSAWCFALAPAPPAAQGKA